jgi:hypothetical protein
VYGVFPFGWINETVGSAPEKLPSVISDEYMPGTPLRLF